MNIILHPGDTYRWKDPLGNEHAVTVTRFLEHDHEHLSVYYLDFPLTEEDIEQEKNNLVISVHGFGFSKPYTATLAPKGEWHFNNCPQGDLFFERLGDSEEINMRFTPKA